MNPLRGTLTRIASVAAVGAVMFTSVHGAAAQSNGLPPVHVYLSVWTVDMLTVDPDSARAAMEPVITRSLHSWGACYARSAHTNHTLAGSLHVRFSVDRVGDPVGAATVTGLSLAPEVATCVASTIMHGRFAHRTAGGVSVTMDVRVQYEAPGTP